jgi:excisionase family DNA binding protein
MTPVPAPAPVPASTATNATPQLYSIPAAAKILDVDRTTLYRWIKDGEIPTVQLGHGRGSKTRISDTALAEYIEARTVTSSRRLRLV